MQKNRKKLSLAAETLVHLSNDAVAKADGGYPVTAWPYSKCICSDLVCSALICSV